MNFLPHINGKTFALSLITLACMPLNAFAETFTATDESSLRAALVAAANNGTTDTIDLNGAQITLLDGALNYEGVENSSLTIENGSLVASSNSNILQIIGQPDFTDRVVINNMTFSDGRRSLGGAIHSEIPLEIIASTFIDNFGGRSGGAVYAVQGLDIKNSYFEGNFVNDAGGVVTGFGDIKIEGSVFYKNYGDRGGAVFTESFGSLTIIGSTFDKNEAGYTGAAVHAKNNSSVSITTSTFKNNIAIEGGGALYFESLGATAEISRTTLWNNRAGISSISSELSSKFSIKSNASAVNLVNTFIGNNPDDEAQGCESINSASFIAVDSLFTDNTCGSSNTTSPADIDSFFGSTALLTGSGLSVGNGSTRALPVLIPAENGPLDDASGDVCIGFDQRGNNVADGLCDIGSIELLPNEQDTDNDGTNDEDDNCPLVANDQSENQDGDELGDACDDDGVFNDDNALPICNGLTATIYVDANGIIVGGPLDGEVYEGILEGTSEDDVMVGTTGRDRIEGLTGNDVICGLEGNDNLIGNNGSDELFGGANRDRLDGGRGSDFLSGGDGVDLLLGRTGVDTLDGGEGNDRGNGGGHADICVNVETPRSCAVQ